MIKFPRDFLWGAATSAYQVEGGNFNSDWCRWEKEAVKEECGAACRHYELYKKDFDLAKSLHHNAHRFSIEWSRIEPKEGRFSRKELKHYLDVILALRKRGIEPIVTLHHFTNPAWFAESGGWVEARSVDRFLRYCEFLTRVLARHVRYWITINEPTIYLSHAYIIGVWPPQEKSYPKAAAVEENLASAHIRAYRAMHKIYKGLGLGEPCIGIAQNVIAFVPYKRKLKNRFTAFLRDRVFNLGFIERIMRQGILPQKNMDFIGVNYYSRQLIELKEFGLGNLATDVCDNTRSEKNSLGWDIYPKGLYDVLMELKKFKLPIMITENGICTSRDNLRWKYIYDHLKNIHRAMKGGVSVTGYLYWSLLDNFEWDKGFGPRFGLIGVDRKTYKRTVKRSARKFAQVCKTGILKGG
ncbi:MAG: glycoside hydrolase family 1 protein [Candidatus Omnitrophica bacterium]|nr:glycoside hydrolase family 1 protein [Candidatus Omnitrophota bacterium]